MHLFKPNIRKLKTRHDARGLLRALDYSRDRSVQCDAAIALAHVYDDKIVPEIVDRLINILNTSENELELQKAVIYALASIPSIRAAEALFLCLNKPDKALRRYTALQMSTAFELGHSSVKPILEMGPAAIETLLSGVYNFQASGDLEAREAVQDILLRYLEAHLHPCRSHFGDRIEQFLEDTILKFEYSLFRSVGKGGLVNLVPACCRLLFAVGDNRVLGTVMNGIMRCDLIYLQTCIESETIMRNEGYGNLVERYSKKESEWEQFKESIRLAATANGLDTNEYEDTLTQNQQKRFSMNMLDQYGVARP